MMLGRSFVFWAGAAALGVFVFSAPLTALGSDSGVCGDPAGVGAVAGLPSNCAPCHLAPLPVVEVCLTRTDDTHLKVEVKNELGEAEMGGFNLKIQGGGAVSPGVDSRACNTTEVTHSDASHTSWVVTYSAGADDTFSLAGRAIYPEGAGDLLFWNYANGSVPAVGGTVCNSPAL